MTTLFLDQSAALDAHLAAMPNLPSVAWEGLSFEPVQGQLYLKPVNDQLQTMPETERDMTTGIYVVNIFTPAGESKAEMNLMADKIANWFKRGSELTYNGVKVIIENVSRNSGDNPVVGINSVTSNGWFNAAILIKYFSLTQRR